MILFRQAWSTYFDQHNIRVIFYSALQSAPSTKKTKQSPEENNETESIDDTEKVLEDLKKNQSSYNQDNLEVSKSPNTINRFDALQLEDDNDEKQQAEINLNNEDNSANDNDEDEDEDDNEEEEDDEDDDDEVEEDEDENLVEQIREEILAYGEIKDTTKKNISLIVNREELIYLLKCLYTHKTTTRENILTIGMVHMKKKPNFSIINEDFIYRLDIQTLVKVQQLILYYSTKKYLYHQHLEKQNIFKYYIYTH